MRRADNVVGATASAKADRPTQHNSAGGNRALRGAGARTAPARAQDPHLPSVGPAAHLCAVGGAPALSARAPPGFASPTWAAIPPGSVGLSTAGMGAAHTFAAAPPNATAPGSPMFGFGTEPRNAAAAQGVLVGANSLVPPLDQNAHLELEMLRLEKERERLLLEQEVEMLRLENEIRERGMQLIQRETAPVAPVAAALYADTTRERTEVEMRIPTLLDTMLRGRGVMPTPRVVADNNEAASHQREVIELDDSTDDDEAHRKDNTSVLPVEDRASSSQSTRAQIDVGGSNSTKDCARKHSEVFNAVKERDTENYAAYHNSEGSSSTHGPRTVGKTDKILESHCANPHSPHAGGNEKMHGNHMLRKGSGKKRAAEKSVANDINGKEGNSYMERAYKEGEKESNKPKRKKAEIMTTVDTVPGVAHQGTRTDLSHQGEQQRNHTQTLAPSIRGDANILARGAINQESDDEVLVVETVDAKLSGDRTVETSGPDHNIEQSKTARSTPLTARQVPGESRSEKPSQCEASEQLFERGAMKQNFSDVTAASPNSPKATRPMPTSASVQVEDSREQTAEPSTKTAIEDHCAVLQRGINQLQERMERLDAYATKMTGGNQCSRPSDSSVEAEPSETLKRIEALKEKNKCLREEAQKASSFWKRKCQEREMECRDALTETEKCFKKHMNALNESHRKECEQERTKHRAELQLLVNDKLDAKKQELKERMAFISLEVRALSNAVERTDEYGIRELDALGKTLEKEHDLERKFYCLQKEELRVRMRRLGREDRYFYQKSKKESYCDGGRNQAPRPIPSDVLGDNMIFLLMRDLSNLEYMADFLRRKMKQDTEEEEAITEQ